ncbi:hypothetical protein [Streptomyces sp. NPDC054849]
MSILRRAAVVTVAAAALVTGAAASSAFAAPAAPATASAPVAVGSDVPGFGHQGGRPIRFGPFEFPSNGNVSAGFAWNTSNGGGIGF